MPNYAYQQTVSVKSYARTLYENYRARMVSAGHFFPSWEKASPVIKKEFVQEARQLLGQQLMFLKLPETKNNYIGGIFHGLQN